MVPKELLFTLPSRLLKLIEQALDAGIELEQLLNAEGLTYDDLRYNRSIEPIALQGEGYKRLDDFWKPFHGTPVVSFFSGAGGLDLGFEAAGFEHLAVIEHNEIFCNTLRENRKWNVIGPPYKDGDVSQRIQLSRELEEKGVKKLFNGVFIGGPPCQPFSIAANQRFSKNGEKFKRTGFAHKKNGNLLFDYVWFIEKYLPEAFIIENVPGLIDIDRGEQLFKVYKHLENKGYKIHDPLKLNAAHYSVPQQRERLFIVGHRGTKDFIPPKKADSVIGCMQALLDIRKDCPNHITRKHKASSLIRYVKLDIGKRDHLGRVDRLNPGMPSKTVIAGGSSGGGRSHLHPFIPRTLSVRECARLQTFPDNYIFTGSSARQFTQVGNAVPPVLAAQIATALYKSYFEA